MRCHRLIVAFRDGAGADYYFPCNDDCCSQFGACALDAATGTMLTCCPVVCGTPFPTRCASSAASAVANGSWYPSACACVPRGVPWTPPRKST